LRTAGTKQTVAKAARNWHDVRRSGSIKSKQNLSCFSIMRYSYTNWILWDRNKSLWLKFSQLQYYQILLKSVNVWSS